MENGTTIIVKWNGQEYEIKDLQNDTTIHELKARIYEETGVRPDRQKLLNLKCKGNTSHCLELRLVRFLKLKCKDLK